MSEQATINTPPALLPPPVGPVAAQDGPPKKDTANWHQGVSGTLALVCALGSIWWPAYAVQFTASAAAFGSYCAGHMKGSQNPDEH